MGMEMNNTPITYGHFTVAFIGIGVGIAMTFLGLLAWASNENTRMFRIVDTERIGAEINAAKKACLDSQAALSAKTDSMAAGLAGARSVAPLAEKMENKANPALKHDAIDFTDMSVQLYYTETQAQKAIEISHLLEKHNARVVLEEITRGGKNLLPNKIYFSKSVYGSAANNMKQILVNWGVKAIGPMGKSRGKKSQIHFVLYIN